MIIIVIIIIIIKIIISYCAWLDVIPSSSTDQCKKKLSIGLFSCKGLPFLAFIASNKASVY